MNILFLMSYSPVPPRFGGALRIYHLLKALAREHAVTVVVYGTPGDRTRLREHFNLPEDRVHVLPRPWMARHHRFGQFCALWTRASFYHYHLDDKALRRTVDRLCAHRRFDVVLNDIYSIGGEHLHTGAVKILHAHNVEYDNFRQMWRKARSPIRRWHYYREYRKVYHEEIAAIRSHDALFVTSECDREKFDADVPDTPKFVIPNGVDTVYFQPSSSPPEPYSLVFTGMMGYMPNHDGMLYFLDEIFPLIQRDVPEAKIYVVGQRPPKTLLLRASERVVVTGFVDDVRPFMHRASVYVVPLRMGSGTRLKILEAMAVKKPIVTTSIGCEGIDVRHEESVLIADSPPAFARSVVGLLRDAGRRERLTRNGYDLVQSRYDWSVIGENMEAVCRMLRPTAGDRIGIEAGEAAASG